MGKSRDTATHSLPKMARALLQFPPEIIHNILSLADPQTLLVVQKSCRFMYNYIKGNKTLYRDMYLNILARRTKTKKVGGAIHS